MCSDTRQDLTAGEIEANDNMEAFEPMPFDEEWDAIRKQLLALVHRDKPADSDNVVPFRDE